MSTKILNFKYEFVEFIPEHITDGVIYVSIPYATVIHRCACGCSKEVVTPLSPTDWKIIFDGKSISLDPSIGNWSFDCQSHYFIRNNRVLWCDQWSKDRINQGRTRDTANKEDYYEFKDSQVVKEKNSIKPVEHLTPDSKGVMDRIREFWPF